MSDVVTTTAPASKPAKVVYFLASHVNPEQIVRFVRACRTGSSDSRVLIHHDYRVSNLERKSVESIGNVDLLEKQIPVEWGVFTMCQMVIHSMQWLLDHRDFDWVVYMSGQDYPIQPLRQIESFLTDTPHDGFIEVKPVEDLEWHLGPQRYLYQYYKLPRFAGWGHVREWIQRRATNARESGKHPRLIIPQEHDRGGFRVGVKPISGPFDENFRCYKGSCWWTLRRSAIEYMLDYIKNHPRMPRHYKRIQFAPNESFFVTILRNNPRLNLVADDNKRFVRWSHPQDGHPDTLVYSDFKELTTSGKHFARKFDSKVDSKIFDALDEYIRA
jgi:Core-2/I-Branching enzyme